MADASSPLRCLTGVFQRGVSLLIVGLTVSWAIPARAGDLAAAEALFDEGRRLLKEGKAIEACPKFEASLRLDEGIGTRLWLGDCYERVGRVASAWTQYRQAHWAARKQNDNRAELASKKEVALEARLPKLTLQVQAGSHPEVWRDEIVVPPETFGVAVPVDPGTHRIVAKSQGKVAFEKTLELAEGAQELLLIPSVQSAQKQSTAGSTKPPSAPSPVSSSTAPAARGGMPKQQWIGLGVLGVGVATIGVGAAYGLVAKSKFEDSKDNCVGNVCNPLGGETRGDARDAANRATWLFGLGSAAVATGVILWVLTPSPEPADRRVEIGASPTPGGAGIVLLKRF